MTRSHILDLDPQDQIVDPAGLADYLQVPIDTIYAWRYKGYGPPAAKVGRHLRYRLGDVRAWLDKQVAS